MRTPRAGATGSGAFPGGNTIPSLRVGYARTRTTARDRLPASTTPAVPIDDPDVTALQRATGGQYTIDRILGRGGMGIVVRARDEMLDRTVAIKLLPAQLAADSGLRERFLREARTAAQLSHPHIVPIHRADEVDGQAFFVMGYVDGEPLAERIRARGSLPVAEVVRCMREVAWALAYAHARGVVHRDVKPENIMIERSSRRAIVTDFGIAHDAAASRLTMEGHVLGSVHFMSPEQASGDEIDGRSDLYALGVVGYQALSGRLPFEDERAAAVIVAHVTRPAPPLQQVAPDVPARLAAVIDRCLCKDPNDRWADGEELADALDDAMSAAEAEAERAGRDDHAVLAEEQAIAVWRRAAQLQEEALQKLEDLQGANDHLRTEADGVDGYRLRDVRQAAIEAGISGQFVALALAEMPGATVPAQRPAPVAGGWIARNAPRILGTRQQSLSVSRVIRASPRRVLGAIGQVLQQDPFCLTLRDTVGGHPLDGGVLVFDLPMTASQAVNQRAITTWAGTRFQLEARQVELTMRALPDDTGSCEVTIYADLRPGIAPNVKAGVGISGVLASVAAGLSGAAGAGMAGEAAATALSLMAGFSAAVFPAIVVGAGVGGLSIAWYRWLYRSTLGKAAGELERALSAVEGSVRSHEVFGEAPPVRRRGSTGDDAVVSSLFITGLGGTD